MNKERTHTTKGNDMINYTHRQLLDMQEFIEDYEFDASEATDRQWNRVIKEALAKGWKPRA
jgi:hypothetical protein